MAATEMMPQTDPAPIGRHDRLFGLLLILATVVCYAPVYRAGFIWDDDDYVYQNPLLPASDGLARIWVPGETPQYYPLVFSSFWFEYQVWGFRPGGYHLVNVLLHALSAVMVWRLLRRMGFGGALMVGVIFALHPVHVESVAWVTERKNVLSGLCYLLAVGCYLRFEDEEGGKWYATALGCFVLGLLSKTVICTLPVALLLLRWWRRRPIDTSYLLRLVPFFVVGAVMGAVTTVYEHENVLHGAVGEHWRLSIAERVLVAGRAIWFYTGKLLWPHPLVFSYPRWEIDASQVTQWLWPLAAVATAGGLWRVRDRWGRGLSAAAWFTVVTVSPALGFINVAPMRFSFVADHFQYLASLGVIVAAVGVGRVALARWGDRVTLILGVTVVVALAGLTVRQSGVFRDVETLWRHTIEHNPTSWLARGNLGVLLRERGELDEAEGEFLYMLEHCAAWPEPRATAYANLGHIQRLRGDSVGAIQAYSAALENMPNKHEARFGLAAAHASAQAFEQAEAAYRAYLSDNPRDARAHFNLALVLEAMGQEDQAIASLGDALKGEPRLPLSHVKLAELYQRRGQLDLANEQLRAALSADPHSSAIRLALAKLLVDSGGHIEASEVLLEGVRLEPQNQAVRDALADLSARNHRP